MTAASRLSSQSRARNWDDVGVIKSTGSLITLKMERISRDRSNDVTPHLSKITFSRSSVSGVGAVVSEVGNAGAADGSDELGTMMVVGPAVEPGSTGEGVTGSMIAVGPRVELGSTSEGMMEGMMEGEGVEPDATGEGVGTYGSMMVVGPAVEPDSTGAGVMGTKMVVGIIVATGVATGAGVSATGT